MPMDPFLGSALISAGAGLVSGIGSSLFGAKKSRQAEDRAFERNKELMKMQNDFNVNMWQKQNAYNSPSNQLQLLKQAGVNPAVSDFFGGSGSTAAEVTSATADVPYNSQIGEYYKDMIKDPTSQVIQALTASAQIEKLRTDIAYQKMLNTDFQNQLQMNEMLFAYDEDGNPVDPLYYDEKLGDFIYPNNVRFSSSKYYNDRLMSDRSKAASLKGQILANNLSNEELEVYKVSAPFLKRMPEKQLKALEEDILSKVNNNTIMQRDVELMKKYGISPNDKDGWTSLIKLALTSPDSFSKIISSLLDAGKFTAGDLIRSNYDPLIKGFQKLKGYGTSIRNPKIRK